MFFSAGRCMILTFYVVYRIILSNAPHGTRYGQNNDLRRYFYMTITKKISIMAAACTTIASIAVGTLSILNANSALDSDADRVMETEIEFINIVLI